MKSTGRNDLLRHGWANTFYNLVPFFLRISSHRCFQCVFFFDGATFPLNCSPWTCQIREYLCKTNESMIQTSIIGGKQFVVLTFRLSWHSRFWLENISVEVFFHFVSISVWKNFHWMCCLVCIYVDDTIDQLVSGDHTLTDDFRLVCSFCIGDWFVSVTIHISNNTFRMVKATKKNTHTLVPIPFNNTLWPRLSRSRQIFHRWLSYKLSESNVKRTNTSLHNAQFAS